MVGDILNWLSGGNQQKASDYSTLPLNEWQSLETPNIEDLKIALQQQVLQGKITPEEAQAALVSANAYDKISVDPTNRQAQMDALLELQGIVDGNGLTTADRGQLQAIATQENAQARGQREALMQGAAARGISGSGLEMLSTMQNQQSSADRASQRGFDVAKSAQDRKLSAMTQSGNLAGQVRTQDYGIEADKAQAANQIAQFNAANTQQANLTNTAAKNAAQTTNLQMAQEVANNNTGIANQQTVYNTNLAQQDYENKLKKLNGITGASGAAANTATQQGKDNLGFIGGIIGAGAAAATGGAKTTSDKNEKKDVEAFDASEFLDSLTGYKYRYKHPKKDGAGEHAGVMAQDLEKTPVGKAMVSEKDGVKEVDLGKGFNAILASLADVNERLKEVEGR